MGHRGLGAVAALEPDGISVAGRLRGFATSGAVWEFVLVLAIPVALYIANPAWLYTPPGWLDSFVPVGLGLNYTDPAIGNSYYKISRLPWNLVEFVVRNSLRENIAQITLQFSLIAASVGFALRMGRTLLQPVGGYVLMLMIAAFPVINAATLRGGSDYQNAMAFPLCLALLAALSSFTPSNIRTVGVWVGVIAASLLCVDTLYVQMVPYVALFATASLHAAASRRDVARFLAWVCAGGMACFGALMLVHAAVGRGPFFFLPEWKFVLSMLANSTQDIWWQPLNAMTVQPASHLGFLFAWAVVALTECVWLAALHARGRMWPLEIMIHAGFVIELAIWIAWQVFGHHTALLPVYFAHPLYVPACLSVAMAASRHVGAIDRNARRVLVILLPVASVVALFDSTRLLHTLVSVAQPFEISAAAVLLFYLAIVLVHVVRSHVFRASAGVLGSASVVAVFLLPLTFAATAPSGLYTPTSCRLYPDFNRFIINSSEYLLGQTAHASDVFIWASPDDRVAVPTECRALWHGRVEDVADSLAMLSHTFLYNPWPDMKRPEDIPAERIHQIATDPGSIVAVVSSDTTAADALRARFNSLGVPLERIGALRPRLGADLPSIFLLSPVSAHAKR